MFLFYLFIFSSLALGTFNVGPFSLRVYFTIIMIFYLIIRRRKNSQNYSNFSMHIFKMFVVYIVLTALALYMNGEFVKYEFPKVFLSRYLNCIVAFFAFNYFVTTPKRLKNTIVFLIVILTINCVVTILQYQGHPIGQAIALLLITAEETRQEIMAGQSYNAVSLFGKDITIGIFNYPFINANYIAIVGMMLIGIWKTSQNKAIHFVCLILYPVFIVASFVTQSRTPFFLLLLFSFYILMKDILKKKAGLFVAVSLVSLLLIIIPLIMDSMDFGRLFDSDKYENDPRQKIWGICVDFISEHLFWGGPVLFDKTYDVAPHNYFLSAFITSGLMGAIVSLYIYIRICVDSTLLFVGKHSIMVSALAASMLIYSAGSLFHNASIISGDTMFFIVFCLMKNSQILEKKFSYEFYEKNRETSNNRTPQVH